jgi:NCS1 family nucleobase:cation symporter-1
MTNTETIRHEDGRIELLPEALQSIKTSPLYNEALAPVPIEKRHWTTYKYAALGHIFAFSGKPVEARQSLAELREMSKQH